MPKTTLTEARKQIRKAQLDRWFSGSRGAAVSWPYRVKQYLTKEFSDKIRAEVQAKCDEWIEKLEAVKPSARIDKHGSWCKELYDQWISVDNHEENAIPTQVLGHKIYVKILDSYMKGNGQRGIRPMERPVLEISRYFNSPHDGDWHTIGELLRFQIKFDSEKQLYYVCTFQRVETKPIEITRKAWARGKCRKEFMDNVAKLEASLEEAGVTIGQIVNTSDIYRGYVQGLESHFIDCIAADVAA